MLETFSSKLQNRFDLRESKSIKHFYYLINGDAVFQILEYGCHGDARATENPSAANLPRYALDGGTS
jgi:hypothetical protein